MLRKHYGQVLAGQEGLEAGGGDLVALSNLTLRGSDSRQGANSTYQTLRIMTGSAESMSGRLTSKQQQFSRKIAGESIFNIALRNTPPQYVEKVKKEIGPIDSDFCVRLHRKTGNPVWLWCASVAAKSSNDVPAAVFDYIQKAGKKFLAAMVEQVCSFEPVQVHPGKELDEIVVRGLRTAPKPLDFCDVLGLSSPGLNLIEAAARDLRDISVFLSIEQECEKGVSRERARDFAASALGRTSAESGPSVASVKKMELRGKKLLSIPLKQRRPIRSE